MTIPPTMGAGIPLYVHPGLGAAAWTACTQDGAPVHWVVVNQDAGPGASEDAVLGDAARAVRDAGVPTLGYITLSYGTRDDFFNFQDADTWVARGITSAFLDECPTGADKVQSTAATILGLRKHGMKTIVLNPGTIPDPGYAVIADQIVAFEGDLATYRDTVFPAWMQQHPPERFAHLLYGVTSAEDAATAVRLARTRGCHTVFVSSTAFATGNPWDGLPTYWPQLARTLAGFRSRPVSGWGL